MDHKQQHHQQHQKEREEKKKEQKEHEHLEEKQAQAIHPLWFLVVGVGLMLVAILIWTVFLS
jgi:hypothetical protein